MNAADGETEATGGNVLGVVSDEQPTNTLVTASSHAPVRIAIGGE